MKNYCQCCGCWSEMIDRAHIKSKGSGGSNEPNNILLLCRLCHRNQHDHGWKRMIDEYPNLGTLLDEKGFELVNEFGIDRLRRKHED